MCGIVGVVSFEKANYGPAVYKMAQALVHRGPDGQGYITLIPGRPANQEATSTPTDEPGKVFLGHRRLKIIDLQGSKQPLRNEDGSIWITFNGEIYNYQELSSLLIDKGHSLREKGDTEVLVHLWEEFGTSMVEHLTGMFSFAIYDAKKDILFLARDRFGQKPLFYWHYKKFFAFASELQALWELEEFPRNQLSPVAIAQYFQYSYIPNPNTVYSGVYCLPPGYTMVLKNGNITLKNYYKPKVEGKKECDLEQLSAVLDKAVKYRMISDVPLGAFLSGGIDSSLIVSSMCKFNSTPVKTFTISTESKQFDESQTAEETAKHLNTLHTKFIVEPDLIAIAKKLAKHYGQPYADFSLIPTYYVCKETRKKVTVALSGDGGDELFAGYESYNNYFYTRALGTVPFFIRHPLGLAVKKFALKNYKWLSNYILSAGVLPHKGENHTACFHRHWRKQVFTPEFQKSLAKETSQIQRFSQLFKEATSKNPLERWLEVDQRMLLADSYLTKVDIASMAVSLECRAPFLDHSVADFANQILLSHKHSLKRTKIPLRQLLQKRIPGTLATLPKKGFSLPLSFWLATSLKDWAYHMIFDQPGWDQYLQADTVKNIWKEHQEGKIDHALRLWMIIAWQLLFKE